MSGRVVTEEEIAIIRRASRARDATSEDADRVAKELGRPVSTIRSVANRYGCSFPQKKTNGPRGEYSPERRSAQSAGAIAANRRRAGLEA